jgi:hypothetical protein
LPARKTQKNNIESLNARWEILTLTIKPENICVPLMAYNYTCLLDKIFFSTARNTGNTEFQKKDYEAAIK